MANLNTAIDQFTNQLAEIGPDAFDGYPGDLGGFKQYLLENQKKISGGFINPNRSQDQRMVIYGDDQKAHDADLVEFKTWFCGGDANIQLPIGEECYDNFIIEKEKSWLDNGNQFPLIRAKVGDVFIFNSAPYLPESLINNISQLMSVDRSVVQIDPDKAEEVLKGRKIYELITQEKDRQKEINKFFELYQSLKIPVYPDMTQDATDEDYDGYEDTWKPGFEFGGTEQYEYGYEQYGISNLDFYPGMSDNYITWRDRDANIENEGKTLESLRNDLNQYFLPGEFLSQDLDQRPEYENRSKGYLKIRNLNHAIIIRNEEGPNIGLTTEVANNFGAGNDYYPKWQVDGFTITMWVRFLNVTNSGTLFNFGNPLREDNPKGFMLDTFIRNETRYARLVVRDWNGKIRDSHFGVTGTPRADTTIANYPVDFLNYNYTEIPVDLKEWYFIVATYDPWKSGVGIDEDISLADAEQGYDKCLNNICLEDPDFWKWNIDASGYTAYSGLGAQCKVEIISRTDLLRARGFQT